MAMLSLIKGQFILKINKNSDLIWFSPITHPSFGAEYLIFQFN